MTQHYHQQAGYLYLQLEEIVLIVYTLKIFTRQQTMHLGTTFILTVLPIYIFITLHILYIRVLARKKGGFEIKGYLWFF